MMVKLHRAPTLRRRVSVSGPSACVDGVSLRRVMAEGTTNPIIIGRHLGAGLGEGRVGWNFIYAKKKQS